ncbi:MAG: proton-conducting membrane transporter [Acidobacteria bacterium]|nr:proton-conducting membrane transporter [Acidobacteriota bacterium]
MIPPRSLPRLFAGASERPNSLQQHHEIFGGSTRVDNPFDELQSSGLLGRGGAGFPTAKKVELLRSQRGHHKFVVVNAMEGEPAAHKDFRLLSTNPHLVLEGAEVLARLIGADRIAVCVARDNPTLVNHVERAIHERARQNSRGPAIDLHTPPWRYIAGEESALVNWLDGKESLPQFRRHKPSILHIGRGAALVDNAETCANVALITRYGAAWYRTLGTSGHPGSTVVSVTGAVVRPTVLEVNVGTTLRSILETARADTSPQAVLLGGYGGLWVGPDLLDTPYANDVLGERGLSVGAGIVVALPRAACGLVESHRVVRWMAHESARQCGPCAFGLPAIAEDLTQVIRGGRDGQAARTRLEQRCSSIEGRGACRHPDGVIRFLRSALSVFHTDLESHLAGAPCAGARSRQRYLAVPNLEKEEELVWE